MNEDRLPVSGSRLVLSAGHGFCTETELRAFSAKLMRIYSYGAEDTAGAEIKGGSVQFRWFGSGSGFISDPEKVTDSRSVYFLLRTGTAGKFGYMIEVDTENITEFIKLLGRNGKGRTGFIICGKDAEWAVRAENDGVYLAMRSRECRDEKFNRLFCDVF